MRRAVRRRCRPWVDRQTLGLLDSTAGSTAQGAVFADGGQTSTFTVEHNRASGPGYDCSSGYRLKIVDYELMSERYTGPGCS